MPSITPATEKEKQILRDNGMNPDAYGVRYRDENSIHLICYKTRDDIIIHRGDRKWK